MPRCALYNKISIRETSHCFTMECLLRSRWKTFPRINVSPNMCKDWEYNKKIISFYFSFIIMLLSGISRLVLKLFTAHYIKSDNFGSFSSQCGYCKVPTHFRSSLKTFPTCMRLRAWRCAKGNFHTKSKPQICVRVENCATKLPYFDQPKKPRINHIKSKVYASSRKNRPI